MFLVHSNEICKDYVFTHIPKDAMVEYISEDVEDSLNSILSISWAVDNLYVVVEGKVKHSLIKDFYKQSNSNVKLMIIMEKLHDIRSMVAYCESLNIPTYVASLATLRKDTAINIIYNYLNKHTEKKLKLEDCKSLYYKLRYKDNIDYIIRSIGDNKLSDILRDISMSMKSKQFAFKVFEQDSRKQLFSIMYSERFNISFLYVILYNFLTMYFKLYNFYITQELTEENVQQFIKAHSKELKANGITTYTVLRYIALFKTLDNQKVYEFYLQQSTKLSKNEKQLFLLRSVLTRWKM